MLDWPERHARWLEAAKALAAAYFGREERSNIGLAWDLGNALNHLKRETILRQWHKTLLMVPINPRTACQVMRIAKHLTRENAVKLGSWTKARDAAYGWTGTVRKWRVYRLEFSDGSHYIGMTSKSLKTRISQHRNGTANWAVTRRIRGGMLTRQTVTHDVEILPGKEDEARRVAEMIENDEIAKRLGQPGLNLFCHGQRIGDRKKDPQAVGYFRQSTRRSTRRHVRVPDDTMVRCSLCRERKPAAAFHADSSRSKGIHSRCKTCCNALRRARDKGGPKAAAAMTAQIRLEAQ